MQLKCVRACCFPKGDRLYKQMFVDLINKVSCVITDNSSFMSCAIILEEFTDALIQIV